MTSAFLKSLLQPCFQVDAFVLHSNNSGKTKSDSSLQLQCYSVCEVCFEACFPCKTMSMFLIRKTRSLTFCKRPLIAERVIGRI